MRRIVVSEFVSLDGVVEDPVWPFPFGSEERERFKLDELAASDALLLGRLTYEGFAAAWPRMSDEAGFERRAMGRTIMGAVVSLDGFIADANGEVGPLFDWYGNGDVEWKFTESFDVPLRTTGASRDFMRTVYPRIGAVVIGRKTFDQTNGWGGVSAAGDQKRSLPPSKPTFWWMPLYPVSQYYRQGKPMEGEPRWES